MDRVNVLILAGGDEKPFLPIDGRPMVEYVVDALSTSEYIGDMAIVGDIHRLSPLFGTGISHYIPGGNSLLDSVKRGIEPFLHENNIIIITSDIPLIRGEIIDRFIQECMKTKSDLHYPIVEKGLNDAQFPGVRRTYVTLKEGRFTGGNILCLNPNILDRCEGFARGVLANRKYPWKIGKLLGYKFLARLISGQMSIGSIEQRIYELLGIRGRAIISSDGELANDVDNPDDIHLLMKFFNV